MTQTKSNLEVTWGTHAGIYKSRGKLDDMFKELKNQAKSKLDFIVDGREMYLSCDKTKPTDPSSNIRLHPKKGTQTCEFLPHDGWMLNHRALDQIANRTIIKEQYTQVNLNWFRALATQFPDRFVTLVNGLFEDQGKRHFIRTLDKRIRAILSNRFRVMDHIDILFQGLNIADKFGAIPLECALTDTKMYIKFVTPEITEAIDIARDKYNNWYCGGLGDQTYLSKVSARSFGDMPGGPDTIHPVCTLFNSETGHGGYGAMQGILAAVCFNIANISEIVNRFHLGENLDCGVFSEKTRSLESQTIIAKINDTIASAFTKESFQTIVNRIKNANQDEIKSPSLAIDNVIKATDLTESAKDNLLSRFVSDYKQTRFGLAQAIARLAQTEDDPAKAFKIEKIAGQVMLQPTLIAQA